MRWVPAMNERALTTKHATRTIAVARDHHRRPKLRGVIIEQEALKMNGAKNLSTVSCLPYAKNPKSKESYAANILRRLAIDTLRIECLQMIATDAASSTYPLGMKDMARQRLVAMSWPSLLRIPRHHLAMSDSSRAMVGSRYSNAMDKCILQSLPATTRSPTAAARYTLKSTDTRVSTKKTHLGNLSRYPLGQQSCVVV